MKLITLVLLIAALSACAGCGDDTKFPVAKLQNPETCKECHPKHYQQWSGSMHAYASEDPVFVAMNKRGQRDTNGELGDFCIKCHAPMALELGLASGANFDPATLPPEAKGITCYFCHNVESVEADHNNGLVLAMDQTMRGGAKNAVDTPAHHSSYDELMASKTNKSTMCGSCHDVVTPKGVHVERTFAEWKDSVFAIDDPQHFLPLTCSGCHMFPTTGVIADKPGLDVKSRELGFHEHMWPAIDQALTPFPEVEAQQAAIKRDLDPAIKIVGTRPLGMLEAKGGICLDPPGDLTVRIDSINVGHMFPSGAAQDRRMWLEVTAYKADNTVMFQSGIVPAETDPETVADPNIATFYDRTFKADDTPAHFFWEIERYDSVLVRPPVTLDPNSAAYDHSTTVKFQVANYDQVDRIEAQVYIRPLAFEIIDDLEASGDLDPSVRAALSAITYAPKGAKSTWLKATKGSSPASLNTNCNPR